MRAKATIESLLLAFAVLMAGGCRDKQARSDFLESAIAESAQRHPAYIPAWDATIRNLAQRYIQQEQLDGLDAEIGRRAKKALDRGCRDPFVRLLWLAHQRKPGGIDYAVLRVECLEVARELYAQGYPQYVRATAAELALTMADYTLGEPDEAARKELNDILWRSAFGGINNPAVSEWQARLLAEVLAERWHYSEDAARDHTNGLLDEAITRRFGTGATLHYLRGARAVRQAQLINGSSPAEWNKYISLMTFARDELEQAWQLDPSNGKIAVCMIEVCDGLTLPRQQMEAWFQRALATKYDGSGACDAKLTYLLDNQLAAVEDWIAFGKEALVRPEYGWNSSLQLWLAHWRYATQDSSAPPDHLSRPEVWRDIKASMEAYLKRYPEAQEIRMHYAYHAWLAHDWPLFREQFQQIDPLKLDLRLIGGRNTINMMKEDLSRPDPKPKLQPNDV